MLMTYLAFSVASYLDFNTERGLDGTPYSF